MALEQFRQQYDRLQPRVPVFPGEREWPDRLRTWDDFVHFGPLVAEDFRELSADERAGQAYAKGEYERRRAMAPDLLDLVFEAFPG